MTTQKKYDIILFGPTGFTGKLGLEYLLDRTTISKKNDDNDNSGYTTLKWACSARNVTKTNNIIQELIRENKKSNDETISFNIPEILQADLLCESLEEETKLRQIVQLTKVVLTCSGPFELYGKTLVKLCAEEGVHYADITGETDFVRDNITKYDHMARQSNACIVSHCGNDCIPTDLTVYEMNEYAKQHGMQLTEVQTFAEYGAGASWSGGTLATAAYQLGKDRNNKDKTNFDPLYTSPDGSKSEYATKNASPKSVIAVTEIQKKAGPWIMGPVMVNCVKRSNALLGYSKELKYGDSMVREDSWIASLKQLGNGIILSAAVTLPSVFGSFFIPQPGQGPDRDAMENGSLKLYGIGIMTSICGEEKKVSTVFQFNKDVAYLYTAVLLVETGMLLVEKCDSLKGGCTTPAAALGSDLTRRILKEMDTSFEINEL